MRREVTVGAFKAGPKEVEYVNDVLATGRLSYGPYSRRFEEGWAEAHASKFAVFSNSGTSALQIALQALKERYGWQDGDEVIVPSVTFVATSNIVLHNRMKPVFVDVDPKTYNINPDLIDRAVTFRTKAIIPVHLCGLPADMREICDIAEDRRLAVIEDSCETAFADCYGKPVGSWGHIGCFSTYMAHYVVTGVGGLCTTSDPNLAVRMRSLMNHGRDSIYLSIDDDDGKSKEQMKEVIARRFSFDSVGHSFRCTEFEAALGVAQLERREALVAARQGVAAKYLKALNGLRDVLQLPYTPPGLEHVFMLFPVVVKDDVKVQLVEYLEERGIETRDLLPLLGQPAYKKMFGDLLPKYPVAQQLDGRGFYIGCHQYLTDEDVEHVADAFYSFFGRTRNPE